MKYGEERYEEARARDIAELSSLSAQTKLMPLWYMILLI
jgi:hypothetical protein